MQLNTFNIQRTYTGFHRLVLFVPVLGELVKSPTICNIMSRKIGFRINYQAGSNTQLYINRDPITVPRNGSFKTTLRHCRVDTPDPPCGKTCNLDTHITDIDLQLYVRIKSHQLRSNRYPIYNDRLQPCMVLVHISHWADKCVNFLIPIQLHINFPVGVTPCAYSSPYVIIQ